MGKKRVKRDLEGYRLALLGEGDTIGLRAAAAGFRASDGYNLRALKAGEWTPAMKRKVTRYHHELQQLTAQEKIVVKTRSPSRLANAQALGGHDPKYKQFKVAFLPGHEGQTVSWAPDNTPMVRGPGFTKRGILFDQEALARDPAGEIQAALDLAPMAQTFALIAGANVMYSQTFARSKLPGAVVKLMNDYNGKKPLPKGSGNRGDKPEAHHYSKWLHGFQAYQFKISPAKKGSKEWKRVERENLLLRRKRAAARQADYRRRKKAN